MAQGYIKLARCLLEKPLFQNEKLLKVWIWCLLKASHKGYEQLIGLKKIQLESGQFIFGREKAAQELNMPQSTVWRLMQFLRDNESLDIKTNNKFSLVTLVNWTLYQVESEKTDSKTNNKWTTNEQQMDTNKNDKNVKNDKVIPYGIITEHFNEICLSMPKVEKITDSRKKTLNARWKQFGEDMNNVIAFFQRVEASDFLTGRKKDWVAGFDWIMKPANFTKIIEGNYDNKEQPQYKTQTQQSLDNLERLCMEYDRTNSKTPNGHDYRQLSATEKY